MAESEVMIAPLGATGRSEVKCGSTCQMRVDLP